MSLLAVPRTDDSYEPAEFFVGSITSNFIQDADYDKLIDFDSCVTHLFQLNRVLAYNSESENL